MSKSPVKNYTALLILLCSLLTTISCKKNETTAGADKDSELITVNLSVDGRGRSFLLYKPKGYNNAGKMPLIFVNHGGQGTAKGMMAVADFRTIADREKLLLIYPEGTQNTWNDGRPTTANQLGVDDVNFFRELCNYAAANLSANSSRIYVTGLSNGGFMAARLGCELSDRIAAIAVVGASFEQGIYNSCSPANTMPAMIIQGTLDPLVPFNGGLVSPGAGGTAVSHSLSISKWVAINKCSTSGTETNLPDIANDGTTITETKYTNTGTGIEVAGYTVVNGGHTWPLGLQYLPETSIGKTSKDMNANEVIWAFFKKFCRNC
jgi:polyhydroxybutyrate depolymerase